MILKTFDGQEAYISEQAAEKVASAINTGVKLLDLRSIGLGYIAPGAIAKIVPGGSDPNRISLPAPESPVMTNEQRQRNLKALTELRIKYFGAR